MNKYLMLLLLAFVTIGAFADVPVEVDGALHIAKVNNFDRINFNEIKGTDADKYEISNSSIVINDMADWQNWSADVDVKENVQLYINHINNWKDGDLVAHITSTDLLNDVTIKDVDGLYRTLFESEYENVKLYLVRETNYTKVFNNSRGKFLESIRQNNPNDKMLLAMDRATNMNEVNSVMNSSYHFNPMILMNPMKTINRSNLSDFLTDITDSGFGANVDYVLSDKINNFGANIYTKNKYKDLYFLVGVNLNSFSYNDNLNDFTGFAYGLNVRAKQYIDRLWLDGMIGINRTNFKTNDIYINENISNNPNGMSEYVRFSVGYDCAKISEFAISPFVGFMVQRNSVMDLVDTDINLHTGAIARYDFVMDGIKYEYAANVSVDEQGDWNIGLKIGFLSVVDKAGAFASVNAFKDEFATNYKFSLNANIQF